MLGNKYGYSLPILEIGHIEDILPSHSLGLVLKTTKPNATKSSNTTKKISDLT